MVTGGIIKPAVIWLTGLSGSGKTTIANELKRRLKDIACRPVILDGDEIRKITGQQSFDELSRKQHNLNVGLMASLFEKQGHLVIVSLISPYADIRNQVRSMCSNFIEVYLSTSLQVCIERDPKGLYRKALSGEIKDFTGISAPYFAPLSPELEIDTACQSVSESGMSVLDFLMQYGYCSWE